MATAFDPLKAAKEELTGLVDVLTVLKQRENAAETAMSRAESELNAIRKLRGFCQMEIDRQRTKVEQLTEESQHGR